MLRLKILASTFPLAIVAFLARGELFTSAHPCIAAGDSNVQLAALPWQATSHVSFTDDPARANVRVQIVDSADDADFAVIDDADTDEPGACAATAATRLIGITATTASSEPVIYLSEQDQADYRIYVRSRSFTARDAAALLVGARHVPPARMAAASL